MAEQEFESIVADAQEIENSALDHAEYTGSLDMKRVIDFSPEKYADMNFEDLLNQEERVEKIIRASKLNIYSAKTISVAPQLKIKSTEIENKVKEISDESLHKAEEMSKEFEKEPAFKTPDQVTTSFEFEKDWDTVRSEEKSEELSEEKLDIKPALEIEERPKKVKPLAREDDFEKELNVLDETTEKPSTQEKEVSTEDLFIEKEREEIPKRKEAQKQTFTFEEETPSPVVTKPEAKPELKKEIPIVAQKKEAISSTTRLSGKKELKPLERALAKMREKKGLPPLETAPEPSPEPTEVEPPLPATVPPILGQAGSTSTAFEKIQQSFDSEWGDERDESRIKHKMLELTRELLRDKGKSTTRREEIKQQIVVLKNLLSSPKDVKAEKPKKVSAEDFAYASGLFATLSNSMDSEYSSAINSLSSRTEKEIAEAKASYQNSVMDLEEGDNPSRKVAFDRFVFALTKIGEQFANESESLKKSLAAKHVSTLDQFASSLGAQDTVSREKAEQKKKEVSSNYTRDISMLKVNIDNKISSLIDASSKNVFVEPVAEAKKPMAVPSTKAPVKPVDVSAVIFEINSMDEGSLLFYLHSKDPKIYKDFERGHISQQEALSLSRRLYAKEKGLNDSIVNKNWGI